MGRCVLCVVLLFFGCSALRAQVLRMPLLEASPYGVVDAQGNKVGLYPDIAQALARETRMPVEIALVPFARAANETAKGGGDATIMMSTAFSESKAVEAIVVFYSRQVLLMRPGLKAPDRKALNGLTIGRLNGGCQVLASPPGETIQFQDINSQGSAVGMLALGRIDAFCSTEEALRAEIRNQGLEEKLRTAQVLELGARPVWLMLSPKLSKPVGLALVDGVKRMQRSGELARIFRKHLGASYRLQTQENASSEKDGAGVNRPETQ